jgi:hypothetical protein
MENSIAALFQLWTKFVGGICFGVDYFRKKQTGESIAAPSHF